MSTDTIVNALLIVRRGGQIGVPLVEFANHWPSVLPAGKARRSLAGVGKVTGTLVRLGLVRRSSPGRRARFSLTPAGQAFLDETARATRAT